MSIQRGHCLHSVKRARHAPIPSLQALSERILGTNGLARISLRKESTKLRPKRWKGELMCLVPKTKAPCQAQAQAQLSLQQSGPPKRRCTIKAGPSGSAEPERLFWPATNPFANQGSPVSVFHPRAPEKALRAPSCGQRETRAFQGTSAEKSVLLLRVSPPGGCPQSHGISQWPRSTCG